MRRVEDVVTSRNDRRIDRSLLPERPPSGRAVSGTRGHAGVGDHAGVRGDLMLRTDVRPTFARWPPVWARDGPVVVPRTWQLVCLAAGHGPLLLLSQAAAASKWVGMVGVRSAWQPGGPFGISSGHAADTAGQVRCGRPACCPGSGHPRTLCRVRCHPAGREATETGRRVGGRWWDAASAGGCEQAGRSGGRGAGRGHRSSPAG